MWNWENKMTTAHEIPYSRYIASYTKIAEELGVKVCRRPFKEWLLKIGVDQDEASEIVNMATSGKLELESSARKFIAERHNLED